MKTVGRKFKQAVQVTRQISIVLIAIGGSMFLNGSETGKMILSIGGLMFALYSILKAFEPIHEEPNWELVYPELGLGHSEELDHDAIISNPKK